MNLFVKAVLTILLVSISYGCALAPQAPLPDDPRYAPVIATALKPPQVITGSIYQPSHSTFFFTDRKARQVGDILTIVLAEATKASKEADTEIKKKSNISIPEPTLFQRVKDFGLQASVSSDIKFKGEADTDQSNNLRGTISVTVMEVLPNGILKIRGEKWVTLNRGDEYIRISGLVRPDDINQDNSVQSNKVADARITYSQTGDLANANSMGWMTSFFNGPLWPF